MRRAIDRGEIVSREESRDPRFEGLESGESTSVVAAGCASIPCANVPRCRTLDAERSASGLEGFLGEILRAPVSQKAARRSTSARE